MVVTIDISSKENVCPLSIIIIRHGLKNQFDAYETENPGGDPSHHNAAKAGHKPREMQSVVIGKYIEKMNGGSNMGEWPRYVVETWCEDCGEDTKLDFNRKADAIKSARSYRGEWDAAAVYDRRTKTAFVVFGEAWRFLSVFSPWVMIKDQKGRVIN